MGVESAEGRFMFIFRSALFVGLGSVVATIIYLTPIPDQFPQSCRRRCHELDWPMICRVKMDVEEVPCLGSDCHFSRLYINRRIPGPTIQVCENDIIMVDVRNRVPGRTWAVHWRGQTLKETPLMDGVSMVTQCPILPYTTFQYKFRASEAGTHFWQFSPRTVGSEALFGALIVKQADSRDVHRELYETDESHHVVIIHANHHQIYITSAEEPSFISVSFNVTAGVKHRMRALFAGQPSSCRARLSVTNTQITVITLDGHPIKPFRSSTVNIGYGERVDFILEVNEELETYHITAEPEKDCDSLKGTSAYLNVIPSSSKSPNQDLPIQLPPSATIQTITDVNCVDGVETIGCLSNVESMVDIPPQLKTLQLDHKIFLFFGVRPIVPTSNATVITFRDSNSYGAPHINNRTMVLPTSPLMTQLQDIDSSVFCGAPCITNAPCECANLIHIPKGDTVELLLVHKGGGDRRHVFHLHGNSFYVVGATQMSDFKSIEEIMELDSNNQLIDRNFNKPVIKDSIAVPDKGIVALRFIANNPGYWLLDQELLTSGMQVILHIGDDSDLPETPKNYPQCGSWVGPEFFLA